MMKILIIIVLNLLIINPSKADNITDFQIEGITLLDSALDHFSEKEIKNFTQNYKYNNKDFIPVGTTKNLKVYDSIQFYYKNTSNKPIHVITGIIWFENNIKGCSNKKKEIISELKNVFPNSQEQDLGKIKIDFDKTGKSTKTNYRFNFNNGDYALVACYDWSKKTKF